MARIAHVYDTRHIFSASPTRYSEINVQNVTIIGQFHLKVVNKRSKQKEVVLLLPDIHAWQLWVTLLTDTINAASPDATVC